MLKAEDVFFFDQNNPKRFETRRSKKYAEDIFSNLGDRREGITVRPGGDQADSSSVITSHTHNISVAGHNSRKFSVANQDNRKFSVVAKEGRKFSVAARDNRKVSIAGYAVHLPPIDPHGPNFIRGSQTNLDNQKDTDTKSILSERKFEQLKEVEEKIDRGKKEDSLKQQSGTLWRLNEAKFASTGILSRLGKQLEIVSSKIAEITLPAELVDKLSKKFVELSLDVVVEYREWQTDSYQDFQLPNNKIPFLTEVPPEAEQELYKSALKAVVAQQDKKAKNTTRKIFGKKSEGKGDTSKQEKRVRMSREAKGDGRGVGFRITPERPMTARSTTSNYSYKSDYSDDGRDSIDYSRLPPELCPTILHYPRESSSLKVKRKEPLTRMEKAKEIKRKNNTWGKTKKVVKVIEATPLPARKRSMSARPKGERPMSAKPPSSGEDQQPGGGNSHMPKTVITFSMSSAHQSNEDLQDWLVHPSDSVDPEAHTLRMWDKKLKELHRKMEEAKHLDKKKGADKPLVVKFYNDPQLRSLRVKHQRSSTVPLPAAFSKLPPSIGRFSPPVANEVLLLGEGVKTFVLTLPDGSGYCRYPSGNLAVSLSRCDMGGPLGSHKGLYTLVFDDTEGSPLLAYFTPLGKACCYHKNGAIKMFSDSKGGSLYNENGDVTRKWEWPPVRMSMPVPVNIHLNVHVSVRCSCLTSMDLRVSVRGQSYKFNIASSPEDLLDHMGRDKDLSAGTISSKVPFFSQAAQSRMPVVEEVPYSDKSKKSGKSRRASRRSRHGSSADAEGTTVNESLSSLLSECDKYSNVLTSCKKSIHELVDQWMGHYCSKMGIRSRTPSSLSRTNLTSHGRGRVKGGASETRLVKSSLGYVSTYLYSRPPSRVQIARSLTHPLNSRASSRPVSSTPTSEGHLKLHSPAGSAIEESQADNKTTEEQHANTLAHSQNWRSSSAMLLEPSSKSSLQLKGTLSQSKTSSSRKKAKVSCPVALHKMMEDKLPTLPQCKCVKHHVPFIFDVEFDRFLKESVPQNQLIVICIKSSLREGSCPCEPLVDSMYSHINKVRFSPCLLASQDRYRLFKYDLDQPVGKDGQPLLVRRHNARAGMFMMYMRGQLVYADNVFNGYSNTETDFMKQIAYSIDKGTKGQFLPSDFKFSRNTGTRIMRTDTWAYPVSGIMHDLIPFSPQSDSGVSTPQKPSQSQLSMSEVLMRSQATTNSYMDDDDDDDNFDSSSLQLSSTSLASLPSSVGKPKTKFGQLQRRKTDMHFKVQY